MMSKRRVGSWVLVCMALGQAACTSMRSVELAGDGVPAAVEAGDRISVATADIRELRERRGAPGKSVGLGVGVALALFVQALSQGAVGAW